MAGKFAEAQKLYQLALQNQNDSEADAAKLHSNLSATSAKLKDYSAAVTHASKVICLQPSWHKGYLRKSHALTCLQQYKQALETIEQGLHQARDTAELLEAKHAMQDLSAALQRSKQPKRALDAMQPASSLQAALRLLQEAGALWICSLPCWRNHCAAL